MTYLFRSVVLCAVFACNGAEESPSAPDGQLTLVDPAPASWHPEGSLLVTGSAKNLSDLTINGQPVSIENEGFRFGYEMVRGIQLIEASAVDSRGDQHWVRHAAIVGDFYTPQAELLDAVDFRLNRDGVTVLFNTAASLIDVSAINDTVVAANPAYEDSFLLDTVAISIDVLAVDFANVELLSSLGANTLDMSARLTDLQIDVQINWTVAGLSSDIGLTLFSDSVDLIGDLGLSISDTQHLAVSISNVSMDFVQFYYDTSVLPSVIMDNLQFDFVEQALVDQIGVALENELPLVITGLLEGFDLSNQFEVAGQQVDTSAKFNAASVSTDGIVIGLDVGVKAVNDAGFSYKGPLISEGIPASLAYNVDLVMSLHDDLINMSLFEAWRSGMISIDLTTDDGSLSPLLIGQLGAETGSMSIRADLPPVLIEKEGALWIQMGELIINIDTPGGALGDHTQVAVAISLPITPQVLNSVMYLNLGAPELTIQVRETSGEASNEAITQVLEESLPLDLIFLALRTVNFPLPALGPIGIESATTYREPGENHTNLMINFR